MQISGGLLLLLYYHICYKKKRFQGQNSRDKADAENINSPKDTASFILALPGDNLEAGERDSLHQVATVA